MFKNYLRIAIRQLKLQKMYSLIKIGGFAMGIAACLLIALYIRDELSFDKSWRDSDRIFRVYAKFDFQGRSDKGSDFAAPFAKALVTDFPEIEQAGRIMPHPLFYCAGSNLVKRAGETQNNYEEGFTYADQSFLDLLGVPLLNGNPAHALDAPLTMVVSKKIADKYFPNGDALGKVLQLNNDKERNYTITGIMPGFAKSSFSDFDFLITLKGISLWNGEQNYWGASNYFTFIKVKAGTNIPALQKKLQGIPQKYMLPGMVADGNVQAAAIVKALSFYLQPIQDVHLFSYDIHDSLPHGDVRFVWLFGAVAAFILFLACINFINLTTAKSANRAKEVGIRKVVGSQRSELIRQFLTESTLFSFFSFVLAVLITILLLPYFNQLAAKVISVPWTSWWLAPTLIAGTLFIGLLAGAYPSFYLSSFRPIQVLKGQLSKGSKNGGLRSVLVVFQFTTSIILIIGTIIIYRQNEFILHRKVGFDKDQVLLIQGANALSDESVRTFKNELLKLPSVANVSISDYLPVSGTKRNGNQFWNEGKTKIESSADAQNWVIDENYIPTLGMKIVEGRNFSASMKSDSQAVIINQQMAKKLNLAHPIGHRIVNWQPYTIVGVVEDFNYESMKGNVGGLVMRYGLSSSIISVKVNSRDMKTAVQSVSGLWKKFSPDQPIRYTFLDQSFASMYEDVSRMEKIFTSFTVLAIAIACLGLFALSAFMAEQRSKEIGIRKVLGATVSQLTGLLSKDFIRLILISLCIATPIAWWAMSKWLQGFEYRIPFSYWNFVFAGLLVIAIALFTISFQSIRAALKNPTDSLRSE